ncbi:uncharacterized protein IL334_001627 [Kwoniella shivajii]|uniref:NAD-dependent epimerase/dehydratase domain-containing protein n=1 Tax=Kwoniella shivajii TaxID=564305 RepID=A0ABZ1CT32_9TREE|nr:hypothetical protein IL334_001627 [Kwoniella shivajii]
MKVLILGATGFIGFPAAEAFVRAGHIVYGTTRSARSAEQKLSPKEIIPVVADPSSEEGMAEWGKIAARCDIVVDALSANGAKTAIDTFHNYLQYVNRPKGSPKPTYIYTSGLWINSRGYGGLDKWTDERQPTSTYNEGVQWRPLIEIPVLESEKVHGIVIRGAVVYGREGSAVATSIFDRALEASKTEKKIFETVYQNESRVASIHTDDMADLYVRVAERGPLLRGQVFMASNQATERLTDVLDAVVRVSGCNGYKAKTPRSAYEEAWASTTLIKPSLGDALTGWKPKKMSLVDGMDIYWSSYLANKNLNE